MVVEREREGENYRDIKTNTISTTHYVFCMYMYAFRVFYQFAHAALIKYMYCSYLVVDFDDFSVKILSRKSPSSLGLKEQGMIM